MESWNFNKKKTCINKLNKRKKKKQIKFSKSLTKKKKRLIEKFR